MATQGRLEKAVTRKALRDHMKTITHTVGGVARTSAGAGLTFAIPARRSDAAAARPTLYDFCACFRRLSGSPMRW